MTKNYTLWKKSSEGGYFPTFIELSDKKEIAKLSKRGYVFIESHKSKKLEKQIEMNYKSL